MELFVAMAALLLCAHAVKTVSAAHALAVAIPVKVGAARQ